MPVVEIGIVGISGGRDLIILRYAAAAILLTSAPTAVAQSRQLLRTPTMNRTHIVFSYAGDLWSVAREGGSAQRWTSAAGVEIDPLFSPDGATIAVTGEY